MLERSTEAAGRAVRLMRRDAIVVVLRVRVRNVLRGGWRGRGEEMKDVRM